MANINEKELKKVNSGVLTAEAETWISAHRDEVIARAGNLGALANLALSYVKTCETVYDVPALKAALKGYGIDVSDLN